MIVGRDPVIRIGLGLFDLSGLASEVSSRSLEESPAKDLHRGDENCNQEDRDDRGDEHATCLRTFVDHVARFVTHGCSLQLDCRLVDYRLAISATFSVSQTMATKR